MLYTSPTVVPIFSVSCPEAAVPRSDYFYCRARPRDNPRRRITDLA